MRETLDQWLGTAYICGDSKTVLLLSNMSGETNLHVYYSSSRGRLFQLSSLPLLGFTQIVYNVRFKTK